MVKSKDCTITVCLWVIILLMLVTVCSCNAVIGAANGLGHDLINLTEGHTVIEKHHRPTTK